MCLMDSLTRGVATLPKARMWALVGIFAIVCSAELRGSLTWTDCCFGHHIKFWSLLAQLHDLCGSLLWSPILPIQCPALPTTERNRLTVGIRSGKFLHWSSFTVKVLVSGRLLGWFPWTGLPRNFPAVPAIFMGPSSTFDGTSLTLQFCTKIQQ